MTTITPINPQVIFVSATTPTDLTEGKLWYNTTNNLTYVSDGTSYELVADVDFSTAYKLIGLNALNILDITAQSSLTAGINANFERDIYIDTDGYLNTIDAGNTTAFFETNKYKNLEVGSSESFTRSAGETQTGLITMNLTALEDGFISQVKCRNTDPFDSIQVRCDIIQNSVTIASKNSGSIAGDTDYTFTFSLSDFSTPLKATILSGAFQIVLTKTSGNNQMTSAGGGSYSGTYFEFSSQTTNQANNGTGLIIYTSFSEANKLIQTDAQTIDAGFTKFMIVTNEETSGTGSVTYDITFDGTNYQEDLESFTEYTIVDTGTNLILKQKLNAGASSGTASTYNWGVLLW